MTELTIHCAWQLSPECPDRWTPEPEGLVSHSLCHPCFQLAFGNLQPRKDAP